MLMIRIPTAHRSSTKEILPEATNGWWNIRDKDNRIEIKFRWRESENCECGPESGPKKKWHQNDARNLLILKVGAIGFEPTTSRSRTERSTRLSHAPIMITPH